MTRPLLLIVLAWALAACGASTAPPQATPGPTAAPPQATPGPTAAPAASWWEASVCYEVFVRSFYDSDGDGNGDLSGLIQKLDYLNDGDPATRGDLGVNCLWLMPVAEAASYHGYDTIDYYSVEQDYGTNADFQRLVREAEARGIKVVVDLVLNHTSSQHPWFQEALRDPASPYRDWYLWAEERPRYRGPWGQRVWHPSPVADEFYYGIFWSEMPDLNYRSPAVTAEAERISAFWLEEMGVAGFRMDAIRHLIEIRAAQADTPETFSWLRGYRTFLKALKPDVYTVGEIFGATPDLLVPYYPDQLDYYFVFSVGEAIRTAVSRGEGQPYTQALLQATGQLPAQRWAPFLTNHDQNRIMSELGDDPAQAKLAALALLTLPGQPYLYYGEELGMLGVKPDEDIRTPMQWTREEGAGFTAGTPWRQPQGDYPTKNVAAQDADPDSLLNTYRELIHLHLSNPALATGEYRALGTSDPGVAAFLRTTADEVALVLINFGAAAGQVALSAGEGALPAGEYTLTPLFGTPPASPAPLSVGADGAIADFAPLPAIPAQTGYVFRLARS